MSEANWIEVLEQHFDERSLVIDPEEVNHYAKDWSQLYQPNGTAVLKPTTVEEVQKAVRLANQHNISLVPSGGRTGLSGGAYATRGEVILSLEKLNKIIDFDAVTGSVTCEAGLVTQQLQEFAAENNLFYPVDFASSGSSQIGGNIATNAGGIKVIRYGLTRDWVLGLKVVTGTGELLQLNHGLIKNATGFDLRQLFIGSEGVLGIIVEATIKLTKPPKPLSVMVLGLAELKDVYPVLTLCQNELPLTAFEFFSDAALNKVIKHHSVQRPFETQCEYYVLLEFENLAESTTSQALSCFEQLAEQEVIVDGILSQSDSQAQALWQLRERISESISHDIPYKNDLSVVPSKVDCFLKEVNEVVAEHYPDWEIIWFGHIGDGNLHLNILKPANLSKADFVAKCEAVNPLIFKLVQQLNGSVSAEHGVGLLKKPYLHYSRSAEELDYFRQIKRVFDPNGILNPGKMFD